MAHVTESNPLTTGLIGRLSAWLVAPRENWGSYKLHRRTYTELSELTDQQLVDIGLTRADIREAARFHATNR